MFYYSGFNCRSWDGLIEAYAYGLNELKQFFSFIFQILIHQKACWPTFSNFIPLKTNLSFLDKIFFSAVSSQTHHQRHKQRQSIQSNFRRYELHREKIKLRVFKTYFQICKKNFVPHWKIFRQKSLFLFRQYKIDNSFIVAKLLDNMKSKNPVIETTVIERSLPLKYQNGELL